MHVIGRKGSFPLKQNTAERSRKPERIPVSLWRDPLPFVNTVALCALQDTSGVSFFVPIFRKKIDNGWEKCYLIFYKLI